MVIEEDETSLGVEIISFVGNSSNDYFISATIQTPDGCFTEVRKTFKGEDTGIVDFSVIEMEPPCFASFQHPILNGIYQVVSPITEQEIVYSVGVTDNIAISLFNPVIFANPLSEGPFYFEIIATDECDNQTIFAVSDFADICSDGGRLGLNISPNPARNIVNIQVVEMYGEDNGSVFETFRISIIDQMNSGIRDYFETLDGDVTLDTSAYSPGVYVVMVQKGALVKQGLLVVTD